MGNRAFPEIKKHLGFGFMRLPLKDGKPDREQINEMVDAFIANGFNYFDTAHGYHNGDSELAIRDCVTSRYPRDAYVLTDKLTDPYFKKAEDVRPFFEKQLNWCGVDYFDFYLMHAQDAENFEKFKRCRAYETAFQLKEEGKIRHVGISFHDRPEVLDRILSEYPQIEIVQIQFNYLDYDNASVQSKKVYEVCRKHGKPVLVMEPVKGGMLVNLPEEADKVLKGLGGGSNASYAIRFAASFDGMEVVLSGMSDFSQLQDNISYMKDFEPLSEQEFAAVEKVADIFGSLEMIPCTSCHYCIEESHCPQNILIPNLFAVMNQKQVFHGWNQDFYYGQLTRENGKASDCIKCGLCERVCPQHLPIRDLLEDVAKEFGR